MRIPVFIILLMLIFVPLAGLAYSAPIKSVSSNKANWTFMVYMDADNSLASYAPDDLSEMMSYGSNSKINIIVLYDSTENGDSAIYYIEHGKKRLLKSLGEVDMGQESTLYNFINWSYHNYPAKHYFLDLWDHGSYYNGVCMDHGDWLTLDELHNALSEFDAEIGKKIDVVGFDACRMGGLEIFYSLSNVANYAVASEKDEPASGWPYYSVLSKIGDDSPEQAAEHTVDSMYDWAKKFYSKNGLSVTLSAVNLTKMPAFINKFNGMLNFAMPVVPYLSEAIINATRSVERYELHSVADLYDLMEKLKSVHDYKLTALADSTMQGVDNIVYSKAWDCPNPANGVHAKHAHGIGIYFPQYMVSGDYYYTAFAQSTLWANFLNGVLNTVVERSTGNAIASLENGTIDISYNANVDHVDIYISNLTNGYSGVLPSAGKYSINVTYGLYTVYIYGYNKTGTVVWLFRENVAYMRPIYLVGKFYLNGAIADGAKITIKIGNDTYTTIQNKTGFNITLYYPRDIWDNTTLTIHVEYGYLSKNYTYRIGSLRSENILPIIIKDTFFPTLFEMVLITVVITAYAIFVVIILRRRKPKEDDIISE